jgi:predicted  nucleic acid-binding Zn-ribbon protein
LDDLEAEIEKLQGENKALQKELENVREQMRAIEVTIGENRKSIAEQEERTSELSDQVEELEECLKNTFPEHVTECVPVNEYSCLNPITSYDKWRLPTTEDGKPSIQPHIL